MSWYELGLVSWASVGCWVGAMDAIVMAMVRCRL
jgi:hypothetical protein